MDTCQTCAFDKICDRQFNKHCPYYIPNFTPKHLTKGKHIEFKKFEPLPTSIPISDVRINALAVPPYVDCTACKRDIQVKTYQHCLDKIQEYLKKKISTDVYDELVEDFDSIYKVLEAELNA